MTTATVTSPPCTCRRCARPVGILPTGRARPYRTQAGATVCADTGGCKRAQMAAGAPSERTGTGGPAVDFFHSPVSV